MSVLFVSLLTSTLTYKRQDLLRNWTFTKRFYTEYLPPAIARPAGCPCITILGGRRRRRCRDWCQKCSYRGGIQIWLRKSPYRPALPSIFLTNARSLSSKMDKLPMTIEARKSVQICLIMVIIETWLHPGIPDEAVMLAAHTAHWADRNGDPGKSKGGGLCIYSNNRWCTNATVTERHLSPDLEFVTLRCRPFYLLHEFTVVVVMAVYIPPSANANVALNSLLIAIN